MTTGSLIFMLLSWAFVLGLLFWSYGRIFSVQARRRATPTPDDDMTLRERFPPTA